MRRAAVSAVLLLVLALTACGDGDSGGSAGPKGVPTVAGIAEKLRKAGIACDGLEINPDVLIAREEGSCDSGDERLTIDTFNNNEARDTGRRLAAGFGVILVIGDRWSVSVDNDAMAGRVKDALGGEVAY